MAQESGTASIYQAAHRYLILIQLETLEKCFEGDKNQIKKQLLQLGLELLGSDGDWRKTVLALAKIDKLDTYIELIETILLNEATSDKEMLRLIDEIIIQTSTLPLASTSGSVRTGETSGRVDSSRQELNGLIYKNVPGLVEHFIKKQHIDPDFHLRPDKKFIERTFKHKLKNTLKDTMLNWITSFVTQLKIQHKDVRCSRTWRNRPVTYLKGVDGKRDMDGAIISWNEASQDVLVPFELKPEETLASVALMDLSQYVYEIFKAQPTRSFVVGVTLCGTWMQVWQFDRSGVIGSKPLDLKASRENLKKFFALILGFFKCNKQLLGFDSSFIEAKDHPTVIRIKSQDGRDQKLEIDPNPVFRASGICGRGTTCWKAHPSGNKSQKFLIKDSWQPKEHPEEGQMLREVTEKKVRHMARYHHHENVHVDGKIVDIQSHVRRRAAFQNCEKVTNKEEPEDPNVQNTFINRVHRRLILKDVGKPIWTVGSPLRLLEALEGCMIGHQDLLQAGYLHRDISINNLLVNDQAEDPNRKSFLIDLDMAIRYPMTKDEDFRARYGTKVFMSENLLVGTYAHAPVDDLESFFWVLIWICIHYPEDQSNVISPLASWHAHNSKDLAGIKRRLLSEEPQELTGLFTAQYRNQHLFDCVIKFAQLMSDRGIRSRDDTELYNAIFEILRQAQGMLREEEKKSRSGKKRKIHADLKSCGRKKRKAGKAQS
ncbi:hypothetical protein MJO29_010070 [Puccinia striiformis f. sp. tritici]|nr:hypothetical protein MJO29_010070 [Puccinia striiformis f. sp. tritici]